MNGPHSSPIHPQTLIYAVAQACGNRVTFILRDHMNEYLDFAMD